MRLLLTGGAGYIGAHLLAELLEDGHEVVVLDNLSTGNVDAVARAEAVAGRRCWFVYGSISDSRTVRQALEGVDIVFHLAAFKRVGESVGQPAVYISNNVGSMATLLEQMEHMGVRRIVFSSSAAVYGSVQQNPLNESSPLAPDSPYGATKHFGEQMLTEMAKCLSWSVVSLRYFNPVGAHPSGLLGEPLSKATSLVPLALQALLDEERPLTVFGTDYQTPDGTCQRDYVHVCDVAHAHLVAMKALDVPGHHIYNVGTGRSYSVREVLDACARAAGRPVPSVDGERRTGDSPVAVADCIRFKTQWGFEPRHGLQEMVDSAWAWSLNEPDALVESGIGHGIREARLRLGAMLSGRESHR